MLERGYPEVSPHDFYRELFPAGSLQQEPEDGKGNIIATQIRPSGKGTEMVMPGDNVEITVELIYPVALNVGLRFAIREGGRTVGSGQITEIID